MMFTRSEANLLSSIWQLIVRNYSITDAKCQGITGFMDIVDRVIAAAIMFVFQLQFDQVKLGTPSDEVSMHHC